MLNPTNNEFFFICNYNIECYFNKNMKVLNVTSFRIELRGSFGGDFQKATVVTKNESIFFYVFTKRIKLSRRNPKKNIIE
jgi:hypothetical protein